MNFQQFALVFFLICTNNSFANALNDDSVAELGILNVGNFASQEKKRIKLNGHWEFYWDQFLLSHDFENKELVDRAEYVWIPGSWTKDKLHPAWGSGTLRIIVKGIKKDSIYSMYVPDMVSNYRLLIDGIEYSRNGQVSNKPEKSIAQFLPKIVTFPTTDEEIEIIIHVSNFDYRKSGILRSPVLGRPETMVVFREVRLMMEVILSAILLAISLFHIGIFIYRRQEKLELIFGVVCLSLFIRIITTGEQILTFYIPHFSWEILRKLEYIPFYITAPLLSIFLTSLFPNEVSKIFNKIYLGISFFLGVFILIFPIRISNHTIVFAQVLLVLGIINTFIIMVKAIIHKREASFLMMSAYFIFSVAAINDVLYANQIIQTIYVSPLGFLIFIVMQSQMLTRRFTKSFTQREILAKSRDQFKYASLTDGLTGLYNMRFLEQSLKKEVLNSIENGLDLSVIMADVDNFKNYNDTWGHKQGDVVLKKMAHIINTSAREKDICCRYGGEEFAIILPRATLDEAAEVSERMRYKFATAEEDDLRMKGITVSIGVAQYIYGESVDSIIERADKALYKAKDNGKNRVELAL